MRRLQRILKTQIDGSIAWRFFVRDVRSNHPLSGLSQIQRAMEQLHGAIKNRHDASPLLSYRTYSGVQAEGYE
jgi:hypothetical protein